MAAAYSFHIAENQPFVDGNKKAALNATLVFLDLNGWLVQDPFRDYLQAQAPPALRPGAFVAAKVPREDYQNPVQGAAHQGPTVYVDALTADGDDVLTLAQSRQWDAHNRKNFWRVFVAIASLAPLVTVLATLRYRIGQAPPRPRSTVPPASLRQ